MTTEQQFSDAVEAENEEGATMIEYALLAMLVAVIALAGLRYLGTTVSQQFSNISDSVGCAVGGIC